MRTPCMPSLEPATLSHNQWAGRPHLFDSQAAHDAVNQCSIDDVHKIGHQTAQPSVRKSTTGQGAVGSMSWTDVLPRQ
jgi:hypothetical protein